MYVLNGILRNIKNWSVHQLQNIYVKEELIGCSPPSAQPKKGPGRVPNGQIAQICNSVCLLRKFDKFSI